MKKLISRLTTKIEIITLTVLSALLVTSIILPSIASSATLKAARPFVMEYRVRSSQDSVAQFRLDYRSETEWRLTVVEGENLGYYMESRADGSVIAGYPQWDEPYQLLGPSKESTLPAEFFVPRDLPTEPNRNGLTAIAQLKNAGLSPGQTKAISRTAYQSSLPTNDLIVLNTQENVAVYSQSLGVPIWISLPGSDAPYFEVIMLE